MASGLPHICGMLDSDWDDIPPPWLPQQHFCSGGLDDVVCNNQYGGDPEHIGPQISDNKAWNRQQREDAERSRREWEEHWRKRREMEQMESEPVELPPEPPPYVSLYPPNPKPERPRPNPPPDRPIDPSRPYELVTLCGSIIVYPPGSVL